MKKLALILLIIPAFFACKKNSPKVDSTVLLTGKWYTQQDTILLNDNGNKSVSHVVGAGPIDTSVYIEFKSDGFGTRSWGGHSLLQPFSFSVKKDTLVLNFFKISTSTIYTPPQPPFTITPIIKKLTSNSLVLYYNSNYAPNAYSYETAYYIKK